MAVMRKPGSYIHNPLLKWWLNAIFDLSIAGLVVFCLLIAYGILPNRWYRTLYVYSGSMSPTIKTGDMILISPPPAVPAPGSIVTLLVDGNLVTHRVIDLQSDGKFTTKGDANLLADEWGSAKVKLVGVYRARIPYLGYVLAAMQNLLKVNASGAWFVDRENIGMRANCCALIMTPTVTGTFTQSVTATFQPTMTFTPTNTSTPSLKQSGTPGTQLPTSTLKPTSTPSQTLEQSPTPVILLAISTFEPTSIPTSTLEQTAIPEILLPTSTIEPTNTPIPPLEQPSSTPVQTDIAPPTAILEEPTSPSEPTITPTPTPTLEQPTLTTEQTEPPIEPTAEVPAP